METEKRVQAPWHDCLFVRGILGIFWGEVIEHNDIDLFNEAPSETSHRENYRKGMMPTKFGIRTTDGCLMLL